MQTKTDTIEADRQLIADLGGPTQLAKKLGLKMPGGAQRVHNWRARGIPSDVKLSRPDLFLRHLKSKRKKNKQSVETADKQTPV